MSHTPFGYKIVDGCAVIDEKAAEQLKKIFKGYIEGKTLVNAAKDVGIDCMHSFVLGLISNKKYLGTDYYPQLIDKETFEKAKAERERRAVKLGRNKIACKVKKKVAVATMFHFNMADKSYNDPFEQAQYIYSLIEREG